MCDAPWVIARLNNQSPRMPTAAGYFHRASLARAILGRTDAIGELKNVAGPADFAAALRRSFAARKRCCWTGVAWQDDDARPPRRSVRLAAANATLTDIKHACRS